MKAGTKLLLGEGKSMAGLERVLTHKHAGTHQTKTSADASQVVCCVVSKPSPSQCSLEGVDSVESHGVTARDAWEIIISGSKSSRLVGELKE